MRMSSWQVLCVRCCGSRWGELPFSRMRAVVSGIVWDGGPEWVRVPYAKTVVACLAGVPE